MFFAPLAQCVNLSWAFERRRTPPLVTKERIVHFDNMILEPSPFLGGYFE